MSISSSITTVQYRNHFCAFASKRHDWTAQPDVNYRVKVNIHLYGSQLCPHLQVDRLRTSILLGNPHASVKEIALILQGSTFWHNHRQLRHGQPNLSRRRLEARHWFLDSSDRKIETIAERKKNIHWMYLASPYKNACWCNFLHLISHWIQRHYVPAVPGYFENALLS